MQTVSRFTSDGGRFAGTVGVHHTGIAGNKLLLRTASKMYCLTEDVELGVEVRAELLK